DTFDGLRFGGEFLELAESAFALLSLQLFFELFHGLRKLLYGGEDGILGHVERMRDLGEHFGLFLEMFQGAGAGDGFDAAYAGGDGTFANDFQDADIADAMDVGAAAEFLGVEAAWGAFVWNRDDPDVGVGIFVAEKGESPGSQCVVE